MLTAEIHITRIIEVHFADAFLVALEFDLLAEDFAYFAAAADGGEARFTAE